MEVVELREWKGSFPAQPGLGPPPLCAQSIQNYSFHPKSQFRHFLSQPLPLAVEDSRFKAMVKLSVDPGSGPNTLNN